MDILREDQFEKNMGVMSEEQWLRLANLRVLLVGLGGLGGHVANSLVRLGVHTLSIVDFDKFDHSNLNRQLFSSHKNIGIYKTDVFIDELKNLNPKLKIIPYQMKVQQLKPEVFDQVDIIIDAVDDIQTKLYLEEMGFIHQKLLVHGAIGGWYGQIGLLTPGAYLLKELYGDSHFGDEELLGSPTFSPAVVANMMVSEIVKYAIDSPKALIDQIMMIDLLNHEYRIVCKGKHL